ncbi:MAG TPA: hypothetical protein VFO77_08215 [Actinoplanes sp.]|nr:hypothetical protein [Actinoplanes sp.]
MQRFGDDPIQYRPAGAVLTADRPEPAGAARGPRFGRRTLEAIKERTAALGPEPERTDTIGLLHGPGHEIRQHRASGRPRPGTVNTAAGTPTPADRRPRLRVWIAVAAAVLVATGGAAVAVVAAQRGGGIAFVLQSAAGAAPDRSVTGPLGGRTEAAFELVTGTTAVTLSSADLGDDLFRISTAQDSGLVPRPTVEQNQVRLHLASTGDGATGAVEIVLASSVTWALRFTGGSGEQVVDLTRGKVSGIDVVGGARRIEMNLPAPTGTVGVRITGAVDEFTLTTPQDNPVRLRLESGAKTVAAGSRTQRDVPPGSTFTPRNWQVADRYDVGAASRITLFSVEPKA